MISAKYGGLLVAAAAVIAFGLAPCGDGPEQTPQGFIGGGPIGPAGGAGDIEGVTAGDGLSGGGTTGTVALALSSTGCTAGASPVYTGTAWACVPAPAPSSYRSASRVIDWCDELDGPATPAGPHITCASTGGTCVCAGGTQPGICPLVVNSAADTTRLSTNLTAYTMPTSAASAAVPVTEATPDSICSEHLGISVPALSDATDRWILTIGFGDVTNAEQIDGAYFYYNDAESLNWQFKTSANSVRLASILDGAVADTQLRPVVVGNNAAVATATGTVYNFRTCCHAARCDGYMQRLGTDADYVRVASACASGCSSLGTSIPPTNAARVFGVIAQIFSTVSAAATRTLTADAVCFHSEPSAAR
jgi:hypothetical protein